MEIIEPNEIPAMGQPIKKRRHPFRGMVYVVIGVFLLVGLFVAGTHFEACPYHGNASDFFELRTMRRFSRLPEAFDTFPTPGGIEWHYSDVILNCRDIYGPISFAELDSWFRKHDDLFANPLDFGENLETFYDKTSSRHSKSSDELSLPGPDEKFILLGTIHTGSRWNIFLYISKTRFLIRLG